MSIPTLASGPTVISDLSDPVAVAWFKREVAVPGTFDTTYPETTTDDVAGALIDGLYKSRLDGMLWGVDWLRGIDADPSSHLLTQTITMQQLGLIIVYSGIRFMQQDLSNRPTQTSAEAPGPLKTSTSFSAGVISERLKELEEMRRELINRARSGGKGTPVFMHDGYAIRVEELYTPERGVAFMRSPYELL